MGDILLSNPLEIIPTAKKISNYSWSITQDSVVVNLNYYAEDGVTLVKQESYYISGSNFDSLKNAVIAAGSVGQKYLDVIEKAIRNKVIAMKGWNGTAL